MERPVGADAFCGDLCGENNFFLGFFAIGESRQVLCPLLYRTLRKQPFPASWNFCFACCVFLLPTTKLLTGKNSLGTHIQRVVVALKISPRLPNFLLLVLCCNLNLTGTCLFRKCSFSSAPSSPQKFFHSWHIYPQECRLKRFLRILFLACMA